MDVGGQGRARTDCRPNEKGEPRARVERACQLNRHSIGAMDVGNKASAHCRGGVLVDVAVLEGHLALEDVHASSLRSRGGDG